MQFITLGLIALAVIGFTLTQNRIRIKGFSLSKIKIFVQGIPAKVHFKTVLFSLIRYVIFSFQFYYLLALFGVGIDYLNVMILITTMYLLVSVIPTIFIFDVVVKGSVGLFVFSYAGINNLTVLSVTTLMWLLNFVLPSILGSYYVLNFNMPTNSNSNN